jgi:GTPase SAR1 family protein
LVGTKIDLRNDEETLKNRDYVIDFQQGVELSMKIGAHSYCECSSLKKIVCYILFDTVLFNFLFFQGFIGDFRRK